MSILFEKVMKLLTVETRLLQFNMQVIFKVGVGDMEREQKYLTEVSKFDTFFKSFVCMSENEVIFMQKCSCATTTY